MCYNERVKAKAFLSTHLIYNYKGGKNHDGKKIYAEISGKYV